MNTNISRNFERWRAANQRSNIKGQYLNIDKYYELD